LGATIARERAAQIAMVMVDWQSEYGSRHVGIRSIIAAVRLKHCGGVRLDEESLEEATRAVLESCPESPSEFPADACDYGEHKDAYYPDDEA
jgi:hypothetical protein